MRRKASDYTAGNRRAASVILADPAAHPACLKEWARLWVANHPQVARRWERPVVAQEPAQMRLFEQSAEAMSDGL